MDPRIYVHPHVSNHLSVYTDAAKAWQRERELLLHSSRVSEHGLLLHTCALCLWCFVVAIYIYLYCCTTMSTGCQNGLLLLFPQPFFFYPPAATERVSMTPREAGLWFVRARLRLPSLDYGGGVLHKSSIITWLVVLELHHSSSSTCVRQTSSGDVGSIRVCKQQYQVVHIEFHRVAESGHMHS